MDKKNVQNRYVKTLLTDEIFLLDVENLWSQFKPNIIFLTAYFFLKYYKKLKGIFSMELNGTFRKCFYAKIMLEILL